MSEETKRELRRQNDGITFGGKGMDVSRILVIRRDLTPRRPEYDGRKASTPSPLFLPLGKQTVQIRKGQSQKALEGEKPVAKNFQVLDAWAADEYVTCMCSFNRTPSVGDLEGAYASCMV